MNKAETALLDGSSASRRRGLCRVAFALLCLVFVSSVLPLGCANDAPGVIHHVKKGENLYRIGLRYGVDAKRIARANGINDERALSVGQRLFIPGSGRNARSKDSRTSSSSSRLAEARARARATANQQHDLNFRWPVRGRLSSNFGRRGGRPHDGIDIAAKKGTSIFASESGRVIRSGRMGGYGKVVIVKHAGAYRSVYAHASRLLVRKGEFVERGQKIAEVGSTGRSTGPHVHFEIRKKERPQDPLALLP